MAKKLKTAKPLTPEKAELIARSQEAKSIRQGLINNAETDEQAFYAASLTINAVLISMYTAETGADTFQTFEQWKTDGYSVRKGEKAFRVWGTPRRVKNQDQSAAAPEENKADDASKYEFYPMCCLFSNQQVDKTDGAPDHDPATDSEALAIETQPAAEAEELAADEPESASALSGNPYVNTSYADQQERRRTRLEERAASARKKSAASYERSQSLVAHIPMGQPILVGHHSERRHRNTLDKSWNALGQSVALSDAAEKLARRAESVGCAGIASDAPDALQQLKDKLQQLQTSQETMKSANKLIRTGQPEKLTELGFSADQIEKLLNPRFGGQGFASFSLTNNSAEIRRTKQRIEALERMHSQPALDVKTDDFHAYVSDGRICFTFFNGKPNEAARKLLGKDYAFKFRRSTLEWVRKTTPNAVAAAGQLVKELQGLDAIY